MKGAGARLGGESWWSGKRKGEARKRGRPGARRRWRHSFILHSRSRCLRRASCCLDPPLSLPSSRSSFARIRSKIYNHLQPTLTSRVTPRNGEPPPIHSPVNRQPPASSTRDRIPSRSTAHTMPAASVGQDKLRTAAQGVPSTSSYVPSLTVPSRIFIAPKSCAPSRSHAHPPPPPPLDAETSRPRPFPSLSVATGTLPTSTRIQAVTPPRRARRPTTSTLPPAPPRPPRVSRVCLRRRSS